MKTQNPGFKIFLFIIIFYIIHPATSFSQRKNFNFSVSTNSIYFPGDEINLNLYSYSSDQFKEKSAKTNFEISILRIKDINNFYSKQSSKYNLDVLSKDSMNLLYLTEEVYSFKKTIRTKNDYGYTSINESIPLKVNSKGAYLVKVMSNNKIAYCGFIISELGMVSKAGNNSMLAFVVDRKSGIPVNNAELNFYLGINKIGQGKTSDGIFYQSVTDNSKNGEEELNPMIIGRMNEDIVLSDAYLFFGYNANRYYTYVYTEQPVYRTNSEVNFKGTIRKNSASELEPYKDKELTVIINDSKNTEVYKEVMRTNSMGSFSGKYKIDENASLGDYMIYANIDENNSYSSSFSVEQYKKPEYKVTVTTDKSQYYGKDILKADIEAKYFFGSPVTDAEVEYNVYKVRYYKPWWMFSDYSWWYEDYYENQNDNQKFSGAEFIYSGKGILNSEGKLSIDYNINEDFNKEEEGNNNWYRPYYLNSDFKYIIQAKVTDKSRREISGNATAFVTRGGYSLSANVDKYIYKPDEMVNITVNAFDFSDKPVETNFEATIYKTTWSRDYYNEKKDYVRTISGRTKSDGKGIASFEIGNGEVDGAYNVEIKSTDSRSNIITTTTYFYVSKGDMWWYYNQSGGVQIIPDKDSYKQGEICHALVISPVADASVLITTNTDNILSYRIEKFNGKSRMIEIPITEKYISGFEVNVNFVSNGILYNEGKNILVIPEEKFLTVQIEPSKLIYKPKETGEMKVRVLDNNGNPVANAEVSIGVVDESIYSIKEDKTRDIRKFFYGQKTSGVSTVFINNTSSNGQSRMITVFEKYFKGNTRETELATVKGKLVDLNKKPISNAIIVIDDEYQAAVTDAEGNFEFKLPEGEYRIRVFNENDSGEGVIELNLKKGQTKFIELIYNDEDNELLKANVKYKDGNSDKSETKESKKESMDFQSGRMAEETNITSNRGVISPDQSGVINQTDNLVEAEIRSDFRDAIYWSPYTTTDAEGYAIADIKYPDNLTSWRITSRVITEDTKVGQTVSKVVTRKDLLVRMESPRFLQENDEVIISTIVHNYLGKEKQAKIKFTGENVLLEEASNIKEIRIAPNTDLRVDWKIKVMQPEGTAKLFAEALTNEESDAMEVSVPLQPKGLKILESVIADFSEQNKSETKIFSIPSGTDLRSSQIIINADPSLAATILTSMDKLIGYPYGCVEQTMSRFLPTVVVANAFEKLQLPVSEGTKKDLPLMVSKGLQRLYSFQHSNGSWGWWENDDTNPFMTAYVIYGLSMAKQAGFDINDGILKRGIESLKQQLTGLNIDVTTRAYMLYALASAEEKNKEYFSKEIKNLSSTDINDYARSLIALTWKLIGEDSKAKENLSILEKNVKTTGEGEAYWEGKQFHYQWQDDKIQTTAMALKAIVNINDKSELKDKIIRWLLMQRQGTAWRNTQETAMIIYAMTDYLKTSTELDPDYTVKVSVNGNNVFEKQMSKEDVFKKGLPIMVDNNIIRSGDNEIRIEKTGRGKLYFSSSLSYYNSNTIIAAGEEGFRIEREYYKIEKYNSFSEDKITYRKKYFSGELKSGDEILVKLKVYSKRDDYQYFMLEDPLPTGAEVIKDDWAYKIEDENKYEGYSYYYWRWWYSDKEVRDNRVTFFATYLGKGVSEFSYIMQVQIPGDYNVNPAKGLLMYYPEVSGNSENIKLKVTD